MTSRKIANPEQFRLNIRGKLNLILENDKHSSNLEKGIFNYALKEATNRNIIPSMFPEQDANIAETCRVMF